MIENYVPRSGALLKADDTVVNEADSVSIIQTAKVLSTGALAYTTALTSSAIIKSIEIHFLEAVTETIAITKVSTNANYNIKRKIQALTAATDFVFVEDIYLEVGQQLKVECTAATATTTANVTITYSDMVQ